MAGMCKATIIGNLGGDPEMRYTQTGKAMTTFRVACNWRRRGPDGEMIEETQWFRVRCFDRRAEIANELLSRGSRVYVEGRLSSSEWTGQDGQPRTTLEIMASELIPLDSRPRAEGAPPAAVGARQSSPDTDLEDLPF